MSTSHGSRAHPYRLASHAMGNVLLGVAIGLLGYYFATDLLARFEQRSLAEAVPVAAAAPATTTTKTFDFDGWEEEDLAYWKSLKEGQPFGRLISKRMGLNATVVKGTSRSDLMKGPGWITYTDLPGPTGNVGVSGHRTTFGAPFRRLDRLRKGDVVLFYSPYRVYTYKVKRVFAVTPDRVDVVESTQSPVLTMTACHPPYSARLRLIAQSDLVSVRRTVK